MGRKPRRIKIWNKTSKIKSALRQVWRWSPRRVEALRMSRVGRGSYLCAYCKSLFGPKEVQVDHVEPVKMAEDWNQYIEMLFEGKLQVLCKSCHLGKREHGRPKGGDS